METYKDPNCFFVVKKIEDNINKSRIETPIKEKLTSFQDEIRFSIIFPILLKPKAKKIIDKSKANPINGAIEAK